MKTIPEIKIEKGVPLPMSKQVGLTALLKKMSVGDSVLLPDGAAGNNCHSIAGYVGIKITFRRQHDGSVRLWRIA